MARRGAAITIEIKDGALVLHSKGRSLTIANAALEESDEDADFVVRLDDIEFWDPPGNATAIEMEELQKILQAIEDFAEKTGFDVAFD